uniref:Calcium release-activated calcium channel protein 1 n=1 Tax=Globisporangium ultimum (strain ATCC 200006 / CBS 805.95 / DAOM BR144) TaxID=431595 RepID=K3WQV8_GLOUD
MATSVVSALFGSYDLRMAKQWRDEDLAHRDQEVQWLNDDIVRAHQWRNADIERFLRKERVENEHLVCEARAEQLSAVSEQCTLLCGFTVSAMTNMDIPDNTHEWLVFAYGVSAAIVCVSLLLTAIICMTLLLAVTRYAGHSLEENVKQMDITQVEWDSPFSAWWLKKCEREQMTAYKLMLLGVTVFFFYLGFIAWIQFSASVYSSSSISVLCLIGFLMWQLRVASKWRYLMKPPSFRVSRTISDRYSSPVAASLDGTGTPYAFSPASSLAPPFKPACSPITPYRRDV